MEKKIFFVETVIIIFSEFFYEQEGYKISLK